MDFIRLHLIGLGQDNWMNLSIVNMVELVGLVRWTWALIIWPKQGNQQETNAIIQTKTRIIFAPIK